MKLTASILRAFRDPKQLLVLKRIGLTIHEPVSDLTELAAVTDYADGMSVYVSGENREYHFSADATGAEPGAVKPNNISSSAKGRWLPESKTDAEWYTTGFVSFTGADDGTGGGYESTDRVELFGIRWVTEPITIDEGFVTVPIRNGNPIVTGSVYAKLVASEPGSATEDLTPWVLIAAPINFFTFTKDYVDASTEHPKAIALVLSGGVGDDVVAACNIAVR